MILYRSRRESDEVKGESFDAEERERNTIRACRGGSSEESSRVVKAVIERTILGISKRNPVSNGPAILLIDFRGKLTIEMYRQVDVVSILNSELEQSYLAELLRDPAKC